MQVNVNYLRNKQKQLTGDLLISISNGDNNKQQTLIIKDNAYKNSPKKIKLTGSGTTVQLDLSKSYGWYDFTITVEGSERSFKRYAGHVETGKMSRTDPAMGGEL
ncbi:MAG: DUF756 domain-containing protein [Chitinophagaceae bacterium]|nr:MAG: DUF756 domain-containing protein [Chitinophagaceae bacterium]